MRGKGFPRVRWPRKQTTAQPGACVICDADSVSVFGLKLCPNCHMVDGRPLVEVFPNRAARRMAKRGK